MPEAPATARDPEAAAAVARRAVQEWFPSARAAWLGGSVARGEATPTSDLDITVLLDGPPAPFRDSRWAEGWPVELFVHVDASLAHYRGTDRARRQPTLARLVGESVVLVDRDGSGTRLRQECLAEVLAGPTALSQEEIDAGRYAVTSLVDDLVGRPRGLEATAVAVALWEGSLRFLLGINRRWTGTGKGLVREVAALDAEGTAHATTFDAALRTALGGDPTPLVALADEVLAPVGGRLVEGWRVAGESGPAPQ